jgi:hypothetical protein
VQDDKKLEVLRKFAADELSPAEILDLTPLGSPAQGSRIADDLGLTSRSVLMSLAPDPIGSLMETERLVRYVRGELSWADREPIDDLLAVDPAARDIVEAIRDELNSAPLSLAMNTAVQSSSKRNPGNNPRILDFLSSKWVRWVAQGGTALALAASIIFFVFFTGPRMEAMQTDLKRSAMERSELQSKLEQQSLHSGELNKRVATLADAASVKDSEIKSLKDKLKKGIKVSTSIPDPSSDRGPGTSALTGNRKNSLLDLDGSYLLAKARSGHLVIDPELESLPHLPGTVNPNVQLQQPVWTAVSTLTPTLRWTSSGTGTSYSAHLLSGVKEIWRSRESNKTSLKVPLGLLQPGASYVWYVTGHPLADPGSELSSENVAFRVLGKQEMHFAVHDETLDPLNRISMFAGLGLLDDAEVEIALLEQSSPELARRFRASIQRFKQNLIR